MQAVDSSHGGPWTLPQISIRSPQPFHSLSDVSTKRKEAVDGGRTSSFNLHQCHQTSTRVSRGDRVLFHSVSGAKVLRRIPGNLESQVPESIHPLSKVQDAITEVHSGMRQTRGPSTVSGSQGGVLTCTDPSSTSQEPSFRIQWPTFSILCDAIRSFLCSSGGGGSAATASSAGPVLSGRYSGPFVFSTSV